MHEYTERYTYTIYTLLSLFLWESKSNKILVHIISHMKKNYLKYWKSLWKGFSSVFSSWLTSSIYSLIIFLKHIFDHITILLRNQQELFMAWEVNPKTSLKQSSACNSLQLPSPSVLHCFSFFSLLSKQARQPAIHSWTNLKFPVLRTIDFAWLQCNSMYLYCTLPHLSVL